MSVVGVERQSLRLTFCNESFGHICFGGVLSLRVHCLHPVGINRVLR